MIPGYFIVRNDEPLAKHQGIRKRIPSGEGARIVG
jgi:hypothetical protein